MKLAIRTCLGEIIRENQSLWELKSYVRVNPTATIVKKTRKGWMPVEELHGNVTIYKV